MEAVYALALGLLLGFTLAFPPGPNNALIAWQTTRSLRSGIITGLGALSADVMMGVLVFGLRSEANLGSVVRGIFLIGAGVKVFLGLRLLRSPRQSAPQQDGGTRTYLQAVVVGISSPFAIVWWFTSGLAFAFLGGVVMFVGLYLAVLLWILAFPVVLHMGTKRRPGTARAVLYVSSAVMFAYAGYFVFLAL